jgi:hypothetical protein
VRRNLGWKYEGNRFAIVTKPREPIPDRHLLEWEYALRSWEATDPLTTVYLVRTTWPHAIEASISFLGYTTYYCVSEIMAIKKGT